MTEYTRTDLVDPTQIFADAGDVGGDVQRSDAQLSSLVFADGAGLFLVQDTYAYAVGLDAEGKPVSWGDEGVVSFGVEISVHEIECTDHTDPGSSEITSDSIYRSGEGTYAQMPTEEQIKAELVSWLSCNVEEYIDTETRR